MKAYLKLIYLYFSYRTSFLDFISRMIVFFLGKVNFMAFL